MGALNVLSVVDRGNPHCSHLMRQSRQLLAFGLEWACGNAPSSQTKANGQGRAPYPRGFVGHMQLPHCLLDFSACSGPASVPLRAEMQLYASCSGAPKAGGLFSGGFQVLGSVMNSE